MNRANAGSGDPAVSGDMQLVPSRDVAVPSPSGRIPLARNVDDVVLQVKSESRLDFAEPDANVFELANEPSNDETQHSFTPLGRTSAC